MPLTGAALAGFEIEGTPALTTDSGLLGNRTHYEQDAKANFRMPDAKMVPAQKKYEDAKAKLVVDKAYRVVTHKGTGKAVKVQGYADSIPLNSALAMVLPFGWQVYQDKNLLSEAIPEAVSFEGGKEWPDVLDALGGYNALRFHIDWYDKVVVMGQGRPLYAAAASRVRIIKEPENGIRNQILGDGKKEAVKKPAAQVNQAANLPPHLRHRASSYAVGASTSSVEPKPVQAQNKTDIKPVESKPSQAVAVPAKAQAPIQSAVVDKPNPVKTAPAQPLVVRAAQPQVNSAILKNDIAKYDSCLQCMTDRSKLETVKLDAPVKVPNVGAEKPASAVFSMFVRKGVLSENIARLSKENGWEAPDWQIKGDFAVESAFSVSAKSFPEAMAKLLMIHPIEADVNTNQRKIYVTKEF